MKKTSKKSLIISVLCICVIFSLSLIFGEKAMSETTTPWDELSQTEKASLFDESLRPYYAKLSDNQKNVYKDIVEDLYQGNEWTYLYDGTDEDQSNIITNRQVSHDEIKQVLIAISYDQPQIFWFGTKDINGQAYTYGAPYILKIHLYYNDYGTDENGNIDIEKISDNIKTLETNADVILNKMTGSTDAENILIAHDELCKNITYDLDTYENQKYSIENTGEIIETEVDNTIYNIFLNKKALCGGYARAFQYLMLKKGIYCEYVVGSVAIKNSTEIEDHAWNNVKIGNDFYGIDVTWDDVWKEFELEDSGTTITKTPYTIDRIDYADCLFNKTTFNSEMRTYADISLQTELASEDIFEEVIGSPRYKLYFDSVGEGQEIDYNELNTVTSSDEVSKLMKWALASKGFSKDSSDTFSINIAVLNSSVYDEIKDKSIFSSFKDDIATKFVKLYRASGGCSYAAKATLQELDNGWSIATITYGAIPASNIVYKTNTGSTMSYDGNYYEYDSDGNRTIIKSVTSISIDSSSKTTFLKGESFSGKLKLTYNDGSSETIDMSEAIVRGYDGETPGTQDLIIVYNGFKAELTVTVKTLDSIAVSTAPTKTSYLEGKDSLDLTGGKLTLTYDNDTTDIIDLSEAEVTGFDKTVVGKQTLTVTYEGKTTTFDVTVVAKSLSSIVVSTNPTKLNYLEGKDELALDGGELTLAYDNDTTDIIDLSEARVTGFDNTVVGKQTLTVTYEGKTTTFDVTVVEKSLSSIAVSANPTKTSYLEGKDSLDISGGKLTLTYDNDTTDTIDLSEARVTGFDNTVVGEQTLAVAYGGKTTTFDVTIIAKSLSSIAVSTNPTKTSYLEGKDSLDLTGGKLTLTYDNDTTDIIDLSEAEVTGFDNTKVGEQTITVTYGGKTTTFDVTVVAKSLSSIVVSTNPTKLNYLEGKDELALAGGKLTLKYNNDTTDIIDLSKATVAGFDNTKVGSQTLTVTYKDKTTTFDVTVVAKSLSSITVSTNPTKTSYLEGKDELALAGGELTLTYNNDTTDIIDLSEAEVTGFNNKKTGKQTLTVTYGGKTTTFAVTITAKSLSSIAISTKPTKLTYIKDKENLNLAGGKLKLTYNNGTTVIIDLSKANVTGFNKEKVGSQTLTVTYGGKTTKFAVTVVKTGLYKEGNVYKYYKNNVLQKINGLSKVPDGTWRYYKNGVFQSSYTGFVKYNSKQHYVKKGVLQSSYTGFVKYNSKQYYVKKGVLQSSYTGLVKYNSKHYYVKKGVLQSSYTGLVKYNSKYYYVKKGIFQSNYTGFVKYNSKYCYTKKGVWQTSFSGKVKISGKTYTIKKGIKK